MNRKQPFKTFCHTESIKYKKSKKIHATSIEGDQVTNQTRLSTEHITTHSFWTEEPLISEILESPSIKSDELEDVLKNRENKYADYENDLYLYFSEVGQYQLLSATEEKSLGKAVVQDGNREAFKRIVLGNLRLVIMVAQRYEDRGLDKADLISEGNLGLMHATRKFDPEKGCRFSTYAVWWIRHYMEKAIMNQGRTVRLPIHINKALKRLIGELQQLSQQLQRRPTVKELSEITGQSLYEIMDLLAYQKAFLSFDNVESPIVTSFNSSVSQNKQYQTINFLVENEVFNHLENILFELEPKERAVIEYRFGINGRSAKTLDKTGKVLGLTRDQVRYLQTKTLEKIRLMLKQHDVSLNDIFE